MARKQVSRAIIKKKTKTRLPSYLVLWQRRFLSPTHEGAGRLEEPASLAGLHSSSLQLEAFAAVKK